jgi:hypothetical protein
VLSINAQAPDEAGFDWAKVSAVAFGRQEFMRYWYFAALCVVLLGSFAVPQQARAQGWTDNECTVSLFWPYSRDPGDCLTDAERRGGLTGTYQDPDGFLMRSPIAMQALQNIEGCEAAVGPEPQIAVISEGVIVRGGGDQRITVTGSNFRCNTQGYFNAIPVPTAVVSPTQLEIRIPPEMASHDGNYPIVVRNRAPTALANLGPGNAPGAAPAGGAPVGATPTEGPVITNERGCNTHLLWPYVRRPGDCLTDAERAAGMVGVYGNSRMAGQPEPEPSTASPLPAASSSGGIFGLFGSETEFGGGGLLDDNLLPVGQQGN